MIKQKVYITQKVPPPLKSEEERRGKEVIATIVYETYSVQVEPPHVRLDSIFIVHFHVLFAL